MNYVINVCTEMDNRNIKYQSKYFSELCDFCKEFGGEYNYPEHNKRYLKQCYYNLQEKYDRGIITDVEWKKIMEVITF